MNVFANLGITELIIILLLALVVVGPERLPELARKLGRTLRDVRKAYENLTRDLGPEFTTIQETTQEIRESLESVRSIPQDMVQSAVKAAELDETIGELKEMAGSVKEVGGTLATAEKAVRDPTQAAVSAAKDVLAPPDLTQPKDTVPEPAEEQPETIDSEPEADVNG
jgi:sec-independent protein translocase protein TatB